MYLVTFQHVCVCVQECVSEYPFNWVTTNNYCICYNNNGIALQVCLLWFS